MAKELYCNKCGKKMDIFDIQEHLSLQGRFGYGSKYDGDDYDLDLCCECMDKLIDECVIPPVDSLIHCDKGDDSE